MSIKQNGGVFGRNPTFNDVTIEGDLIINGEVFTGLDFQGSWNASTNSPALASSVGTNGEFYIVSVAGATNLNGITNWGIGDWAIFNGTAWQRVEGGADGNFNDLTANSLTVTGNVVGGSLKASGTEPTVFFNDITTGHDDWKMAADWDKFSIQQYVNDTTYTTRMTFDASGNVLVGKTATDINVAGVELGARVESTISGSYALRLNRLTSDGKIAEFRKDGASVGSIGTDTSDLTIYGTVAGHTGFRFGNGEIYPTNNGGSLSDNTASLGSTSVRFKDLHLSGGVYLGGTGSANLLDDYESGTWTAVHGGQNMGTAGHYTKVGQMVTLVLDATSHASATSSASITGLPFIISSSHSAFNVGYTSSAAGLTGGYCNLSANSLIFTVSGGISAQNLGASERVMLTATYVTTA